MRPAAGSPVQKEASAFLYISHTSACLMGNMQKRSGFSASRGSISCTGPGMVAGRSSPPNNKATLNCTLKICYAVGMLALRGLHSSGVTHAMMRMTRHPCCD